MTIIKNVFFEKIEAEEKNKKNTEPKANFVVLIKKQGMQKDYKI